MPNGRVHEFVNITTAAACAATVPLYQENAVVLIGVSAGVLVSAFVTPDLADLAKTRPERIIRNSLGCLSPVILWPFWILQARTKHRSIISHSPIGTAIRLLLLWPLLAVVWYLFGLSFLVGLCLGVALGDMIHVALDGTWSWLKGAIKKQ